MINVYVTHGYKNDEIAMKYGLGYFLNTLYSAIRFNNNMNLVFKPEKADVIHINEPTSIQQIKILRKYNKPIITHYHTFQDNDVFRYALDVSDLNVFVSNKLARMYSTDNYRVVYNGIVPEKIYNMGGRPFDFIITSRASALKGLNLDKANGVDKYMIVTTGDLKIDKYINLGYLNTNKFNYILSITKIHLLPSLFEPFGMATLYAMSQGCIPAVSVNAGIIEILPDELTIKVHPDNIDYEKIYDEYIDRNLNFYRYNAISFSHEHDYRWYSHEIYKVYMEVIR